MNLVIRKFFYFTKTYRAWSNEFIWCIEDELKNLYTQNLVCVMQTLIFHLEIFINLLKFSTM